MEKIVECLQYLPVYQTLSNLIMAMLAAEPFHLVLVIFVLIVMQLFYTEVIKK